MAEKLIPGPDALALAWMQTLANGIAGNTALYMRSQAEADALLLAVGEFATAYAIAIAPGTRTPDAVNIKSQTRANAEGLCRLIASQIKMNAAISDAAKIAIGVRPVNPNREQRDCPQSSPVVAVVASTPGAQTLMYHDSLAPERRAKPMGATCLQLFVVVSENAATSPDDAKFLGDFTTNPIGVAFDFAERGLQATYFARWGGKRNQHGQWSLPVSMTIAA